MFTPRRSAATKRNRAVPISAALRAHLDRYTPAPSQGHWYFPSPLATRYDPDNFSRDLRNAHEKAGLRWTCLDYRHTFGSQLAMKGESLYKISPYTAVQDNRSLLTCPP